MSQTPENPPDKEREIARQKRVFGGQFEIRFEKSNFCPFSLSRIPLFRKSGMVD
jgi:hypothetical protein